MRAAFLLTIFLATPAAADYADRARQYLLDATLDNGAVGTSPQPSGFDFRLPDPTTPVYRVDPYFSALGLIGLLDGYDSPSLDRLALTEDHMLWHLATLNADGTIDRPWYYADGTPVPPDPAFDTRPDSEDAYAGVFLQLAWKYVRAGGDPQLFHAPGVRDQLESIADVMFFLQDTDGLTWEADDLRLRKFLADNSEVYAGFRSMAAIQSQVYGDAAAAQTYAAAADVVRAAILADLYDGQSFQAAKFADGSIAERFDVWPTDEVLIWPALFGVVSPYLAEARAQHADLDARWRGAGGLDWTDRTDGWSMSYLSTLLGRDDLAALHRVSLGAGPLPPPPVDAGAAFTSADAGWLLRQEILLGDYNRDGVVDPSDVIAWSAAHGDTLFDSFADGNRDGVVDAADYVFTREAQAAAAQAIPEPTTAMIFATALFMASRRTVSRGRHRSR